MKPDLFGAGPVLPVPDVAAAVQYYQQVLGFSLDFIEEPPNHGSVTRDRVGVQFTLVSNMDARSAYPGWTYIFVNRLDELFNEYLASGAKVTRDPESHPHGMREFEIEDLNGHRRCAFYQSTHYPDII